MLKGRHRPWTGFTANFQDGIKLYQLRGLPNEEKASAVVSQYHNADFTLLFPSKRNMANCIILLLAEMPPSSFTAVIREELFVYLGEDKSSRNEDD